MNQYGNPYGQPQGTNVYNNMPTPTKRKINLKSRYTATAGKFFLLRIGVALLTLIPIIGLPNAICIMERYRCKHTQIVGMNLEFTGKAGNLLGRMIVWGFFSIITLGIYAIFLLPIRFEQWKVSHTVFGPVYM